MERLCHATAATALPAPNPTAAPGFFSRGDPLAGLPASVITADFLNGITEELIAVIAAAGLTPDIADNTQLLQASLILSQRTNRVLNSQMADWYTGVTSLPAGTTGSNYTARQWRVQAVGSTYSVAQGSFADGQSEVPGAPQKYLSVAVASAVGGGNYCRITQPLEDIRLYGGRTLTVSFWARATAATPVAVALESYFGPSHSAAVPGQGAQKFTLTTSWQPYAVTADINSISGKTIATSANTYLDLQVWLDAGSDFNAITDTLGQGSKTVELTNVSCVIGAAPGPLDVRSDWLDTALLNRYYQGTNNASASLQAAGAFMAQTVAAGARQIFPTVRFANPMRIAGPTLSILQPVTSAAAAYNVTRSTDMTSPQVEMVSSRGFVASALAAAGSAPGDLIGFEWAADARF